MIAVTIVIVLIIMVIIILIIIIKYYYYYYYRSINKADTESALNCLRDKKRFYFSNSNMTIMGAFSFHR